MIGSEDSIILINCVEHYYFRKKFGVVYIRRHKVILFNNIYKFNLNILFKLNKWKIIAILIFYHSNPLF